MQYNYWLDVCGFVLIAVLITLYLIKQTVSILQNSIYYTGIMFVLFATVFDVASVAAEGISAPLVMGINTVVQVLDIITAFIYGLYITVYVRYHVNRKFIIRVLVPPLFIGLIMLIINLFTGFIFYVTPDNRFMYSQTSLLFMACECYYLIYCLVMLARVRDSMSREKLFLLIPFTVLLMWAGIVEFYNPAHLTKHFMESLLSLALYFGIRNPDELYDDGTGMLNDTAMISHIEKRLSSDKKFYVIAICVHDVPVIYRTVGKEATENFREQISDFFFKHDKSTVSFRLSPGLYCMVPDRADRTFACDIQNEVIERFSKPFVNKAMKTELFTSCCMLEMPKDAKDVASLMDVIKLFSEVGASRNMTVVSTADLDLKHIEYMRKVDEKVRNAMRDDRLEVYYQPIFSCHVRRFVAAEALIRMHDDEHGFISPEIFIPVAENNGTIIRIDNYVMDRVCAMIARNRLEELGVHYIELNLSPGDCIQDNLVENVKNLLQTYNINPSSLNLEITETASDEFTGIVDGNVKALHELGINFSLDDYGTGYSSLSRILALPLKIIKIDKSLVQPAFRAEGGTDDERSRNIKNKNAKTLLLSSVDMIKRIGGQIVTEGVETKEQAEEIIRMGCDYIQGFYFARPMPEDDFIELLKNQDNMEQIRALSV